MSRSKDTTNKRRRKKLLLESFEDRILCAAQPEVTLIAPTAGTDVKIGSAVDVTVRFDNVNATDTGYGPYADVFIKATGADGAGAATDDGLSLASATFLGTPVTTTTLTFDSNGRATHPYAKTNTGAPLVVDLVALGLYSNDGNPNNDTFGPGDQMLVFQLPFGSTTPEQPAFDINMRLNVSNLADVGTALPIYARGGFQFGNDALDNPTTDPSIVDGTFNTLSLNPTVFTVTKYYTGYENTHTANITPGQAHGEIPTGPNFKQTYRIEVDIATGQTISSLNVQDILQNNMQYVSTLRVTNSSGTNLAFTQGAISTTTPGGTLSVTLTNPITGGSGTNDVVVEFEWFVPRVDSTSAVIINATTGGDGNAGDDILTNNNVLASGNWTPIDVRDSATTVTANDTVTIEGIVSAESLSVQKGATVITDVGPSGLSPGDVVEWTIVVEVSDYFAYNNLVLSDLVSDGHRIDTSFLPTFAFGEHANSSGTAAFAAANWAVSQNFTGAVAGSPAAGFPAFTLDPASNNGTTSITWNLSNEMVTRGFNSNLTGGGIDSEVTGLAGAPRNNPPMPWGGTTATIKFRTVVQDVYSDDFPSGEPALDQGDAISNGVVVSGNVLNVSAGANLAPTGSSESDDGGASLQVAFQALQKTIYAINGNTSLAGVNYIRPGDSVTYRVQYTIPTSDIENFIITDYLPLPVFDTGTFNVAWNSALPADASVPGANVAKRGPNDTFTSGTGINPTIAEPGGNSISFNYGTYSDPANTTRTVDILFTVVVNSQPFADALFLTNQAVETNNSTGNTLNTTTAIQQIKLGEPIVGIYKGVVGTNSTGLSLGGLTFNAPGGATTFGGTLSTAANAAAIGANNAAGLDAADTVRFAVIAQNTGHSDAFDVSLTDTIPGGYVIPATLAAANFTVRRGDGTLLVNGSDYTSTYNPGTGQWTVTLVDNFNVSPGLGGLNRGLDDADAAIANGSNGLVITYDVAVATGTQTGSTITNTATLTNYSNVDTGTDFTTTNPTDSATVTLVAPTINKTLVGTEFTTTGNNNTQAVIGELVTYTVTINVPEGTTSPANILDTLDAGLAFYDVVSATASAGISFAGGGLPSVGTNPSNATIGATGGTIAFGLGTITNSNTVNATAESITITYRAVARNIAGNQSATLLNNSANLTTGTTNVLSSAANITIVEPALSVSTQASANNVTYVNSLTGVDALDTVYFRVRITNGAGAPTAFEMALNETLPSATFLSGLSILSVTDSSGAFTSGDFEISGQTVRTIGGVPSSKDVVAGTTIDIIVQAQLTTSVQAAQVLTTTGTIQWSSLDGTVTNRSTNNLTTNDEERTGVDGVGGALNDYAATNSATIRIDPVVPVKTVVGTSEAATSGTGVAVGEIVRYQLAIQIPEGTQTDIQLQDFLPAGMQFFNDGSVRVAYIANTAGTYSNPAGASLSLAINDSYRIVGSTVTTPLTTPSDAQVGATNSLTADNNTWIDGTDVFFKFGSIVNNDSDANAEYIVVEFNASVLNVASNQVNTTLSNGFQLMLNGSLVDSVATTNLTVVEPNISVAKARTSVATQDSGDTVTYTITVTNTNSANSTTAHNLNVADLLDNDLTLVSATDSLSRGSAGTTTVGAQTQLDYTISTLAPGESIVITVTATIDSTASASEVIQNNAVVTWTSLAGTGTALSGSTQGGAGTSTGERIGTGGGVNDQTLTTNTVTTTIAAPVVDKLTPSDTTWTIGDTVEFWINVTLPEGVTENLVLTDVLPSGLTPLSYEVFAAATSAGTTTIVASNFAGSAISAGPVTVTNTDGLDVPINLGNVTTTNDNNTANNNFLVRVTTRVSDVVAAANNATLTNQASLSYRVPTLSASSDPGTGTTTPLTDSVNITVQEPLLQIVKSVDDSTPNINQTVNFTLTVSHTGASTTTAYDVRVRDVLPAGMTLTSVVTVVGATVASDSTAGNTVDLVLDSLAFGGTATLTFTALVNNTLANVGATFDNNARIFWDTQATDEATNAIFSNTADGTPDRDYGAIFGNTEAFNATTDPAQDTERLVVNTNTIAGTVYEDVNANGVYNVGTDTPINGVSLTLSGTTASGLAFSQTVVTSGAGAYQFINIPDGASYTITEAQPGAYQDALETVGTLFGGLVNGAQGVNTITTISVPANQSQNATGYNFGEYLYSSISGTVYSDADLSNSFNAGDAGLGGATVVLTGTDMFGQAVNTTTTTARGGAYTFANLAPGTYTVTETQPAGFTDRAETVGSLSGSAAVNDVVSGIVVVSNQTGTNYNFGETVNSNGVCYIIGDNGGSGGANSDIFVVFGEPGGPAITVGDTTGTFNIETMAFRQLDNTIFAMNEESNGVGRLGIINPATGLFTAVNAANTITTGTGALGTISIGDVDALNFNPFTGVLWAAARRDAAGTDADVLFQINPATGLMIPNAFGPGVDYIPVGTLPGNISDVDDLAWDPVTGTLYAIENDSGTNDHIITINPSTGAVTDIGQMPINDVEGFSFSADGTLHATTGNAGGADSNSLWTIDKTTGGATLVGSLGPIASDTEAVACNIVTPGVNTISGTVFFDSNANGLINAPLDTGTAAVTVRLYRDMNGDGALDGGDILLTTQDTVVGGTYNFTVAASGAFVMTIDTGDLPVGFALTTDNIENANFGTSFGLSDTANDYGYTTPGSISGSVYQDFNNNGIRDGGETGISLVDVRVQGTDFLGNVIDTTLQTDGTGNYTFSGLYPGTYSVTETSQPAGFLDGRDTAGTPLGGTAGNETTTGIVMVGAGAGVNYNFGELPPASISGIVYSDFNNNGVRNAGEPGIGGVSITLTGTDDLGNPVSLNTTTTLGTGVYTFTNLRPGAYVVSEAQPFGFTDGLETTTSAVNNALSAPNSAGTAGSDTYTGISIINVAAGNRDGVNYNFGEIPTFSANKTLVSTNQSATTGANLVVGEVARFQLVAGIPVGGFTDVVLAERLPAGLLFLNNGTAAVSLVSSTGALLTSSTIAGAGATTVGTPTTLLANAAISSSLAGDVDTYVSGTDVYFRLGNLTNNDTDADEEFVVIEFDAIVTNEIANQSGTALANTFTILADRDNSGTTTDTPGDTFLTSGPSTLTVVEPRMVLDKTASPTSGLQAGNTVTYTITLSNPSTSGATATAFDALIADVMPAGILITSIDNVSFPGSVTQDSAVTITGGGTGLSGQFDIPIDATVTITYTGTLQTSVNPNTNYTNTATLTFTSINGVDANERTGTSPNLQGDGSLNDYRLVDTATISTTNTLVLDKTSPNGPYTVGDTVPYTLTLTVLEGTTNNVQIADVLPAGLQFTAGSVTITPAVGMTVTNSTEATAVTAIGQNVNFNLGTVTNPAGGGNTVTVTFNVLVLDSAANSAATALGQTKTNTATATATGTPPSIDTRDVQFVEPKLVVSKGVDDATPDINQVVTFTVTVEHAANSSGTAYDIRVRDLLPAGLTLDTASFQLISAPGTTSINAGSNLTAGNQLDFTLNQLLVGESATFTYQARVVNSLANVGTTLENNVRIFYDTQAGDEPNNAIFNNAADGTPDRDYGAVFGTTEVFNATTDDAQDTERLVVNTNSIAGVVYADNDSNGVFSAGDTRLNNVPVRLTGTTNSGLPVDVTFNTVNGDYSFTGLPAGIYTLTETQPLGYTDGLETIGSAFGGAVVISDAVGSNTMTGITIPTQGSTAAINYNFGETLAASIAGQVYRDFSNNGIVNAGEPGINGVTVTLTGTDIYGQTVNETLVTSVNGNYLFNSIGGLVEGLRPGNYTITEVNGAALDPYFDGIDSTGTAGGAVAGVAPQRDVLTVTLPQNNAATSYNFGELDHASISGFVFSDTSNDGVFDATESGINNVSVRLTGTDDRGNAVNITVTTPLSGAYSFTDLRPGNYTVTEVAQPGGYADGIDTIGTGLAGGGNSVGTVGADLISNINIINVAPANNTGVDYNFGEIFSVELSKTVVGSSESFTGPVLGTERVAIGEIVRYRVVVEAPESTYDAFTIRDTLPAGLRFINDGSATLAMVSNGNLVATTYGFGGSQISGSSSAVTPTFQISNSNISSDIGNTADSFGSGGTVYFHLGSISNTDSDSNKEYFVVEFNAQVLNETGNQAGTTLSNTFDVLYDADGNGTAELTEVQMSLAAPTSVVVAESNLAISKALLSSTPPIDAGDQVTYRITLTNNAAGNNATTAFNIRMLDLLDAISAGNVGADLELINTTLGSGITITAPGGTTLTSNASSLSQLDLTFDQLAAGASITVDITTRVVTAAPAGATLTNSVTADYTSLPGTGTGLLVNTNNGPVTTTPGIGGLDSERTGADVPTPTDNTAPANNAVLNNYAVGATIPVGDVLAVNTPTIDKVFGGTSEAGTTGTNVAIGETVTFDIRVTLPEGTTQGVIVTDNMQPGLEFLGATVNFAGSGVTSFALPAPTVTGDSGVGTRLVYSLGNLTNAADNNAGNNTFTITVTARVSDLPGNVSGTVRSNAADLQFTDPDGPGTGIPTVVSVPDPNGDPQVTVVEPQLQIVKAVDDTTPDIDQVVTYTLTVNHQAGSTSDAYDVRVRDLIPHNALAGTGLILDTGSIFVNGVALGSSALVASNATSGDQLDLTLNQIAVGETVTITYQARVENTLANVGTFALVSNHDNNARIYWDSIAGDEADNAVFNGNTPDGTPDRDYGATPGLVEAHDGAVDLAQDGVRVTVNTNSITGVVYRDENVNGTFENGVDERLDAVTVRLTGTTASGLAVDITTQTVNGDYAFTGLPAGTYVITETQPVGLTDAVESVGTQFGGSVSNVLNADTITGVTIPAQSNTTGVSYNFGEVTPSSIAGSVYHDLDNDGFRDALEAGLVSEIRLTGTDAYGQNVDITLPVTSGAGDGRFLFNNLGEGLRPGNYVLTQTIQPSGYLDGKETAGTSGGSANSLTSVISAISLAQGVDATDYLFGEVLPSSVSGTVYVDASNDGVLDAGEARIGGVLITLTGTDDRGNAVNQTFTTLNDGTYSFTGLRPGNYTLTETQPGNYNDGLDSVGTLGGNAGDDVLSNITTTSGDLGANYNFGERGTVLSGTVFRDQDRAGDLDAGTDTGIDGVTLTLLDNLGNTVATTTTNPDGTYQFTDVPAGDYSIVETQPAGYGSSTPNTLTVTVPLGGLTDQNFGETLGSLSGRVYLDVANNGAFDGADSGIGGVKITLTGTDASGAPVTRSTTTNFDGTYTFADLLAGTYAVRETQPTTFNDGIDTAGSLAGTVANDFISNIVVPVTTDAINYNFGETIIPPVPGSGAIRGTVFRDADRDGVLESGDSGIGLVTLELLNSNGDVVSTTTTGSDGRYSFNNVAAGTYSVRETQPAGYGSSTPNTIASIVVPPNTTILDQDFGETTSGLAGRVFTDLDKDGVFTAGEPGISGVTLTLTGTDVNGASVNATTLTDSNGNYSFDGLLAGTYRITETQPANRADGLDAVGTSGGTAENDILRNIALAADTQATEYNFGELLPSITGTVFRDDNKGGTIDGTEPGIGGVELTLRDNLGNIVATTTTNPDGTYEFTNVVPGNYTITETQPAGYGSSTPNVLSVPVSTTNITNQNFGETTGSLAGTVYRDVDTSNTLNAGDSGLGGVIVRLTGTDAQGNVIDRTLTTNPDGTYLFDGLLGGTYRIEETQPSGLADGAETVGTAGGDGNTNDVFADIGLGNGIAATGYNFGETLTPPPGAGAVTGTVWLDADRDGVLDSGETGIGIVTLQLVDSGNNVVDTVTTGPDGRYVFPNVAPGTYSVVETQPAGYGSSTPNTIGTVTVVANAVSENNNFGETLGSLAGTVYRDANNDGTQSGVGETGIAGVLVTLTGTDINGNPVNRTTTTDANGDYIFADLVASNGTGYTVTETQPANFNDGLDAIGTSNGILGNDVLSGVVLNVTGSAVTDATEYNFGERGTTLSGNVWVDRDRDGVREPGTEPNGLAGVLITLLDANGDIVGTTTTDSVGDYSFSNLAAGDYTIVQTQPNGYGSSTLNVLNVTIPTGGLTDQNFGETVSTIAGQVFRDDNQDGTLNGPDRGIEGVQVRLVGTDATGAAVNILTTTDATGNYQFIDLLAGNYTVIESQPADYRDGADTVGSVGGLNLVNDRISSIGLGAAVDATDYDYAEIFRYDPTKTIVSTNNIGTSGNNLSVGETVRFRLVVALPDGALNDVVLEEFLPRGLTFLNDGTAAVAFVSGSGNGLTSTTLAGLGLGSTDMNVTPTFLLSDAQVSSALAGNEDAYRSGTDVFFKLGNITNTETAVGDPEREFVVLEFNARVGNEIANQNGRVMDNTFAPRFDLNGDQLSDPLPPNIVSPPQRTIVAEPILSLDKQITAGPATPKPGDVITFTVTVGHAADSRATAWESLFSDTLPNGMTLVSITTKGNGGAVVTRAASASGSTITGLFDIPVGGSVTITYQVRIGAGVKPGTTLTNGADITWTSMPGDAPVERKSGDSLLDKGGINDYELVAKQSVKVGALPTPPPTGPTFFWDGFNNFANPFGRHNESPFPIIPSDNDIYRAPLLPLQPIYSGEADPGSTLVLTMYNTRGENIGSQTVVVDSGGNWLATFPSTTIRDYPNTVQISQISPYYSIGSGVGHNLRTYYSPALNAGHFFFQIIVSGEYGDEAPLLGDREFANPINDGNVKYHGEVLGSQAAARGY